MKNTHIEHPEDSVLTGDLSVLDWFVTKSNISAKIDGAPAIVWGTNPANGRFFVGTKSVFNKFKIKINHSHEEIDNNHGHIKKVANILHKCFDCLPRTNCIYQGDFIGFGGDNVYQPNTIAYAFPEIIEQDIIIAPHTLYTSDTILYHAVASPLVYFPFDDTDLVKWIMPEIEIDEHRDDIKDMCDFARQIATLCEFVTVKKAENIKKQLNAFIKNGSELDDLTLDALASANNCDINVLRLWKLIESIKLDMFAFISVEDMMECYIMGEEVDHEGYVMVNEFGTFKIVNRRIFSYFNFVLEKSW